MKKILSVILSTICFLGLFVITSCSGGNVLDSLKLDRNPEEFSYAKDGLGKVKLTSAVDGDTANFSTDAGNVKVRFFSIDTPESTGDIDKWGLAASNYTKNILKEAHSIALESNSNKRELDNYQRDLAYVWYKPTADSEYKNLCLQLVEEGYSANTGKNGSKYNDIFNKAEERARKAKKIIWSNDNDPLFSDTPTDYDLKYIKENEDKLYYKMVRVEAYVVDVNEKYLTIQNYIDGKYYNYTVYMHNTVAPNITYRGNLCSIVGTIQPHGNGYQISGVQYGKADGHNSKVITSGYYLSFGEKPNTLNPAYNFGNVKVSNVTLKDGVYTFEGVASRFTALPQEVNVTFTVPQGSVDFSGYVGKEVSVKGYNNNGTKREAKEVSFTVRSADEIKEIK